MPSKWSLNVYLVGRLEMMEEDGMPYVRVTENGVGQGEASLMLGSGIVPGPGIRYRISGKIRGSSGYIGAYIYLKTGGYIVRRLLNVTRQSEWMAFNTILDTDIKDVSHIVLCLVAARLSKIEVGDMKIEKDKYQEQLAKSYVIANESMRLVFHGSGATTELIDLRNGNDMLGVTTTMFKAVSKSMGDLLPDYVTFDGEYIAYNLGLPNSRRHTLERAQLYDQILRDTLAPKWPTMQTAYVLHQLKECEQFIVEGQPEVKKTYYRQAIGPLPQGIPLYNRIVWALPPALSLWLIRLYKKLIRIKQHNL